MSAAVAAAAVVGSSSKCSSSNSSNASFNLMSSTSLSHINSNRNFSPFFHPHHLHHHQPYGQAAGQQPSRYESQKRRDWATFGQYLKNHKPPLSLPRCSGAHVLEFLRYLDQFGKTKVHADGCPFFGHPHPPAPCPCPLKQAWGSLDALVGRLRAAFEENGGQPEMNPFGARAVRLYLRDVRDGQAKARGIAYEKKKRKKPQQQQDHHHPEKQRADKNHNNMVMKSNYGGNNINGGNESGLGAMEVSEPRVGCMGIALSVMNF